MFEWLRKARRWIMLRIRHEPLFEENQLCRALSPDGFECYLLWDHDGKHDWETA